MKVVLPDQSELELPDGATGLDAARAIGPKLAEQAVLVRSNGRVQDLRLPLEDGQPIQILTTRDASDPDALAVLRHSSAHLLAEAVRHLYPGVKIAIGPPIENGFYYDFEFPEPIREDDLPRIEEEIQRELAEGREWTREEVSADEARKRFQAENEPYKVELVDTADGPISFYTQGDFTDLCRGPHLQDSRPIKAIKLTGLAGAYWRGDEKNKQLTRIYGTAFYSQADLDAYLERLEEAKRRDHRRLGAQLDLFHFDEHSPGSPFWHPKGMVIWNELEDLRRRENFDRGYLEVRTPLIYDKALWVTSGHWEKFRENMFLIPIDDEHVYGIKPMNCPGHMLLFGSSLRSYRDLPLRYAEAAPLHRNELAGALHGLTRVRYVTQDDAHIFCTEEQVPAELDGCVAYVRYLYGLFGLEARAEFSTRPDDKLGSDDEWDFAEGEIAAALARNDIAYEVGAGEDRSVRHGRSRPVLATGDDPARSADAGALRADVRRGRQHGAPGVRHPSGPLRLIRAVHCDPDRALRRCLPGLARPGAGAADPGRRGPPRGGACPAGEARGAAGGDRRAGRDGREAHPRRRGGKGSLRRGLRGQGVGRGAGRPEARRRANHPIPGRLPCRDF